MSVCPQNSYVEILTPTITVLESEVFGKLLGHWGKALKNKISILRKGTQNFLLSFYHLKIQEVSSSRPGDVCCV